MLLILAMPHEILFRESIGVDGSEFVYIKPPESSKISRLNSSLTYHDSLVHRVFKNLKVVFLAYGYPQSVSEDYTEYQVWDTLQAFCSTISNTLTTEAILKGMGVGNETASSVSAAITWVLKDGTGMLARILFAWLSGLGLDSDCKKWRLFADLVNDAAMLIELGLLPLYSEHAMSIFCVSSSLKAIVGVAGGATRAAVTQHQAIKENMGDVSAKDGSQETCVNLIASLVGISVLSLVPDRSLAWMLFFILTVLHLYANFRAVRSLCFSTLNPERYLIVLCNYLLHGEVLSQKAVNKQESVFLLSGLTDVKLCGYKIYLGSSLQNLDFTPNQVKLISNLYKDKEFLVTQTPTCIQTVLSKTHICKDVIEAYFHAVVLGIASSLANNSGLMKLQKGGEHKSSLFCKLTEISFQKTKQEEKKLNIAELIKVYQLCNEEFLDFYKKLELAGWNTVSHQLHVIDQGWRGSWGLAATTPHSSYSKHHVE